MSTFLAESPINTNGQLCSGNNQVPLKIIQPISVTWTHNSDYKMFNIKLYRITAGGVESVIHNATIWNGNSSYTFPNFAVLNNPLYLDSIYYWQVMISDANIIANWSSYSAPVYFQVPCAPNAPTLNVYNSTNNSDPSVCLLRTPTLSWNYTNDSNAEQGMYQVTYYSLDVSWGNTTPIRTPWIESSESYHTLTGTLTPNYRYAWSVQVKDINGAISPVSKMGYFKIIESIIGKQTSYCGVSSTNPDPCSTLTPELTWDYIDPTNTGKLQGWYKIEMYCSGVNSIFSTDWIESTNLKYTLDSKFPLKLLGNKLYYWRITLKDTEGIQGPASPYVYFKTSETLANHKPIVSASNCNGLTNTSAIMATSASPTLNWVFSDQDPNDTQDSFSVLVYNISGTLIYQTGWVDGTEHQAVIPSLSPGTVYAWTVQVKDSKGLLSSVTTRGWFKTPGTPPVGTITQTNLYGLPNNPVATTKLINPLFTWDYQNPTGSPQASFSVFIYKDGSSTPLRKSGWIVSSHKTYTPVLTLDFDTIYYWTVQAKNADGNFSPVSSQGYFITPAPPDNRPPNKPTLITFNGTLAVPKPCDISGPVLSWNYSDPDNDAQGSYLVEVFKGDNTPHCNSGWLSGVTNTRSFTVTPKLTTIDTIYYWRVTVRDSKGLEGLTSDLGYFKTTLSLSDKPTIASSNFNGIDIDHAVISTTLTPILTWTYSGINTQAQVNLVLTDITDATPVEIINTNFSTSSIHSYGITSGKLTLNHSYKWTVQVKDSNNNLSNITEEAFFTSLSDSVPVVRLTNFDGVDTNHLSTCTTLTPTLTWNYAGSSPQAKLNLILTDITDEITINVIDTNWEDSLAHSYLVAGGKLTINHLYKWTVQVKDGNETLSNLTDHGYFKVVAANQIPTVIPLTYFGTQAAPAGCVIANPILTWNYSDSDGDLQGAYNVIVYSSAGAKIKESGWINLPNKTFTVLSGIVMGSTYYWTVQVKDSKNNLSAVSDKAYFKYGAITGNKPVCVPITPKGTQSAPASVTTLTPTFTWSYSDKDSNLQARYILTIFDDLDNQIFTINVPSSSRYYTLISTSKLNSSKTYSWTIQVEDSTKTQSDISAKTYFKTSSTITQTPDAPKLTSCDGLSSNPTICTEKPIFTWTYNDPQNDPQGSYYVTIYNALTKAVAGISGWISGALTSYTQTTSTLIASTNYYWTVQVKDNKNNLSPVSNKGYFKTATAAPNRDPIVTLSTFNSTDVTSPSDCYVPSPILTWSYSDPDGDIQKTYKVTITDQTNKVVYATNTVTSTIKSITVPSTSLTNGSTYYWTVEVTDGKGGTILSPKGYFKLSIPNKIPKVVTCNYNGLTSNTPITCPTFLPIFVWNYSDIDKNVQKTFTVDIYNNTTGTKVVTSGLVTSQNYFYVSTTALVANTTYYWQVIVTDSSDGVSVITPPAYFRTSGYNNNFPMAVPSNYNGTSIEPVICNTLKPSLTWNYFDSGKNAQLSYLVTIYDSANVVVYTSGLITSPNQFCSSSTTLVDGKVYYWTVTVKNALGVSSTVSLKAYFIPKSSTNKSPNAPVLTSNFGISSNPTPSVLTPILSWTYSDIDGDPQGSYMVTIIKVTNNTVAYTSNWVPSDANSLTIPIGGLPDVTSVYKWVVQVKDNQGNLSLPSLYGYFKVTATTIPLPIAKPSNYNGLVLAPATGTSLIPTFTWTYSQSQGNTQVAYLISIYSNGNILLGASEWITSPLTTAIITAIPDVVLLRDVVYNWTVQVKDSKNNLSAVSDKAYFKITTANVTPFVAAQTYNGHPDTPVSSPTITPILGWSYSQPQNNVQAKFIVTVYDINDTIVNTNTTNSALQSYAIGINELTLNTVYYWTVQVTDSKGNQSTISEKAYFKTPLINNSILVQPTSYRGTVSNPTVCTACVLLPPTLTWSYVDPDGKAQAAYNVIVHLAIDGTVVVDSGWFPSSAKAYIIPNNKLVGGTIYYWTVQVKNTLGVLSSRTEQVYFRTDGIAPVTSSVSLTTCNGTQAAPNVASLTGNFVDIKWRYNCTGAVNGTSSNIIIYGSDNVSIWNLVVPGIMTPGLISTASAPKTLFTSNSIYHVTVEVTDTANKKTISPVGYFEVDISLDPLMLPGVMLSSCSGIDITHTSHTTSLTPTLSWSYCGANPQATYEIWIFDYDVLENGNPKIVINTGVITSSVNSYTVPSDLLTLNHQYMWMIEAIDSQGNQSNTSHDGFFKVVLSVANIPVVTPSNYNGTASAPASCNTLTPQFTWGYTQAASNPQAKIEYFQLFAANGVRVGSEISVTTSLANYTVSSPLPPNTTYCWTIQVIDDHGNISGESVPAFFTTPIL